MSELILISSAEEVSAIYAKNNVNPKRVAGVDQKFNSGLPAEFTVKGLIFVDLKIGKKELKNIPAFAISDDGKKYVLVGQLMGSYTNKKNATQITKEGKNKDRWLVVNNKKVNDFVDSLSEAEVVAMLMGKTLNASKAAKDLDVYSGVFDEETNEVSFHLTAEEAMKAIKPKSYQTVTIKG